MYYAFDIEVAKEYGVDEAVLIRDFQFCIMQIKAENRNFYDGRYWVCNSQKLLSQLFPFWSPQHIRRTIENLIKKGVLIKGNYNESPYDRTLWYAFVDEDKWLGSGAQQDLYQTTF